MLIPPAAHDAQLLVLDQVQHADQFGCLLHVCCMLPRFAGFLNEYPVLVGMGNNNAHSRQAKRAYQGSRFA